MTLVCSILTCVLDTEFENSLKNNTVANGFQKIFLNFKNKYSVEDVLESSKFFLKMSKSNTVGACIRGETKIKYVQNKATESWCPLGINQIFMMVAKAVNDFRKKTIPIDI